MTRPMRPRLWRASGAFALGHAAMDGIVIATAAVTQARLGHDAADWAPNVGMAAVLAVARAAGQWLAFGTLLLVGVRLTRRAPRVTLSLILGPVAAVLSFTGAHLWAAAALAQLVPASTAMLVAWSGPGLLCAAVVLWFADGTFRAGEQRVP
jgi:hypothetical protein